MNEKYIRYFERGNKCVRETNKEIEVIIIDKREKQNLRQNERNRNKYFNEVIRKGLFKEKVRQTDIKCKRKRFRKTVRRRTLKTQESRGEENQKDKRWSKIKRGRK